MSNICQNKKYHFIYKTTNLLNETFYYGMHSTNNLNDNYSGSGKRLRYSIEKHGIENFKFEIIEFLPDRETLALKEVELITEEMLQHPLCMNLKNGGHGGCTKEVQLIRSKAGNAARSLKLKTDKEFYNKLIKQTSERFKKMHENGEIKYDTFTGKKHTEETKKQIGKTNSIKQAGERNSQFGKCWIHNNEKSISIKKEQLEVYLNDGWSIGRKIKFCNEIRYDKKWGDSHKETLNV